MDYWNWYRERLLDAEAEECFRKLIELSWELDLYDQHLNQRDQ